MRDRALRGLPAWFRVLRWALLASAALLFALHFVHLGADFPNDSPWVDWAKYTDEGWYADAAVRQLLFRHWYLPGDFNPAVALPVWPLLLWVVFHFTGVSLVAARATAVVVFGVTLCGIYGLLERFNPHSSKTEGTLAAPLAVLMLCASPFLFAFDRLAILEPLLTALAVLALLAASYIAPGTQHGPAGAGRWGRRWAPPLLAVLLAAAVLTKTTAVALFPAIAAMLWSRAGGRLRVFARMAAVPFLLGGLLWASYMLLSVRPHYMEDYRYLFSANAYTGFQLQPLATVLFNTVADGAWMGPLLYVGFWVGLALFLFVRPSFFRNPLVTALLVWIVGYTAFLAYHNNLQPRYYTVLAVPVTAVVSTMLDAAGRRSFGKRSRPGAVVSAGVCAVLAAAVVLPDAVTELEYLRHPSYSYERAAGEIAALVRADAGHPQRILSVSGSDLTLMTGLPSIDDDFGTLDLDQRVQAYKPGWYVAWNELDDDKMDALTPLYRPVRVATFPVMDDPDRDQLILYRLDPATGTTSRRHRRRLPLPRPLRTRLGQQPTPEQLRH